MDGGRRKRTCLIQTVCERTREGRGRGSEGESSERFEVRSDLKGREERVQRCLVCGHLWTALIISDAVGSTSPGCGGHWTSTPSTPRPSSYHLPPLHPSTPLPAPRPHRFDPNLPAKVRRVPSYLYVSLITLYFILYVQTDGEAAAFTSLHTAASPPAASSQLQSTRFPYPPAHRFSPAAPKPERLGPLPCFTSPPHHSYPQVS